jgi:hypothetical protein
MKNFTLLRKFGKVPTVSAFLAALFGMFSLSSCEDAREILRGSADLSNAPQNGQSKYRTKIDPGANLTLNFLLGSAMGNAGKSEYSPPSGNREATYTRGYSPYSSYQDYRDAIDSKDSKEITLGLWTGLEFVQKGYKTTLGNNSSIGTRLNYLEAPVYGMYQHPLMDGGVLYGGLGPYFAYGIGGKTKDGSYSSSSYGENNGGNKRFDAGLGIIAGYRFKFGLSVDLSYELGLVDIAYASEDITAKNRTFSINLGYSLTKFVNALKK